MKKDSECYRLPGIPETRRVTVQTLKGLPGRSSQVETGHDLSGVLGT